MARKLTDAERARSKYAAYCRDTGVPLRVTDEEHDQMKRHIARLYNRGMSFAQIADASPSTSMVDTAVSKIYHGTVTNSHRDTYNAIMATPFIAPTGLRTGRRMEPTGMKRRLQALVAQGIGYTIIGQELGITPQAAHQLANGVKPAYASTYGQVSELYDKLREADPYDLGADKLSVSRARNSAARKYWATPACWDDDTIDDPYAIPQWTGRCGTPYGRELHEHLGIRLCPPCRDARGKVEIRIDGERMCRARERKFLTQLQVARMADVKVDAYRTWESGRSNPRFVGPLERVLAVLDVTLDEVTEIEEES